MKTRLVSIEITHTQQISGFARIPFEWGEGEVELVMKDAYQWLGDNGTTRPIASVVAVNEVTTTPRGALVTQLTADDLPTTPTTEHTDA